MQRFFFSSGHWETAGKADQSGHKSNKSLGIIRVRIPIHIDTDVQDITVGEMSAVCAVTLQVLGTTQPLCK